MPEFAPVLDLSSLGGDAGFGFAGAAGGDRSGFSTAGGGDVNGDGFADLLVGAPYSDAGGTDRGLAYVVFGAASVAVTIYTFQGERRSIAPATRFAAPGTSMATASTM